MNLTQFVLLLLAPIFGQVVFVTSTNTVQITTSSGNIKGTIEQTDAGTTYNSFRGIRYVQKPGRFEPSVPVLPWTGVYDATADGASCMQGLPTKGLISEDCLFVNVYTPQLPNENLTEPLAVMFWVFGGGFYFGESNSMSYDPEFFMDDNVVIVTINYRLGVYGFLSTGDSRVPGNNGLKDLIQGLAWVQNNIQFFGGDPQKVTIFGQSAGSVLVSLMTMSPLTQGKGYFVRAIMESGSALVPWGFQRYPKQSYNQMLVKSTVCLVAALFNLDLQCLKALNVNLLTLTSTETLIVNDVVVLSVLNGITFSPTIEPPGPGAAITTGSYQMLLNGDFQNISFISGVTSQEMLGSDAGVTAIKLLLQVNFNAASLVPTDMYASLGNTLTVSPMIQSYYSVPLLITLWANADAIQYASDAMFYRGFRKYISLVGNQVPNYAYVFSYTGENSTTPAAHTGELSFLWANYSTALSSETDFVVKDKMTRLWTNFAKTGNPTPDPLDDVLGSLNWPATYIDGANINYINFGQDFEVGQNPMQEQYVAWSTWYNNYGNPRDTY